MARTPSNQQRWFLSQSPSQNPEPASAPSNTKDPSSSPSKLSSSSFPGASSTRTALKASTPAGGSVPSVSPTEILCDLYVYLEKFYKPLLAVICKHKFIREAHYPVKQSARLRFVRDAYEEGGLLGYNDEVIRQVLVNVKRYFLDKVGMPDVFGEENMQFGEEVDDMVGFDVVVGDWDGGGSDNGGGGDGDEVLDSSFGGTESEEPFADAVDNLLERILKDADAVYGRLAKMPLENGKTSGPQTLKAYSDSNQSQTGPVNPKEWKKSEGPQKLEKPEKKRKRSCVKESVEMYPEADEPLDGREKCSADPIEGQVDTMKHEKKRKKKRSRRESLTEVSCETGEPLDDQEEEIAEPVESQAKQAKSENKRKRKRSHGEVSVEVSRGSDEPQDDREGKPVNPVESQIKPAKHEKKSNQKRSSVEDFLEMLREMQEPLENSADPAETGNEKSQVPSKGESGAAQRRARRRKKNQRNKNKLRKPASSDALTEIKTPKQDHAATEESLTQDFQQPMIPGDWPPVMRTRSSRSIPDDIRVKIDDAGLDLDPFLSDSTLSDVPSDLDSVLDSPSPSSRVLHRPVFAGSSPDKSPETSDEAPDVGPLRCAIPPPRQQSPPQPDSPSKHILAANRKKPRPKLSKISPYFPRPLILAESCLPFPPIDALAFGLIQEQLAHDPFRLLLATIFLNRTRGGVALPVLFRVFDEYPTVEAMAAADPYQLTSMINSLGFQNQRAKKCITLAQTWLETPPCRGKRYRKLNYPRKLDGRDVKPTERIDDDDSRVAWEIAHLPGVGAYALDSWRIFCRDELRGLANDWQGNGPAMPEFTPEWKSVLPQDKELRAYLTWMWLKEGWVWDRETGETTRASDKVMRAARRGGTAHMEEGNWTLETSPMKTMPR